MPPKSVQSAETAADAAADAVKEAASEAERSLSDIARRIEKAISEGLKDIGGRGKEYADVAGEQLDTAQRYVVDRVQEKPLTSTLAALGVGVLIGIVLAGRNK